MLEPLLDQTSVLVFLDLENQGEQNSALDQYTNLRQLFEYCFAVTLI